LNRALRCDAELPGKPPCGHRRRTQRRLVTAGSKRRRQVGVERRLPPSRQELRPQPQRRRIRRQQELQQAGGGGEGVPARLRRALQRHLARRRHGGRTPNQIRAEQRGLAQCPPANLPLAA
jgi:hypothetical protein